MFAAGEFRRYLAFCREVYRSRGGRCQCCRRTAPQARQRRLHVHHLLAVSVTGVRDPLVFAPSNVLLLCNYCHSLQHAYNRQRSWADWAKGRGVGIVAS